jgi:hypothetical protein
MDLDAIDAAFAGLRKLVDLGRFMERVRPTGSAPDGLAARELMEAGRGKALALVKQLQGAPPDYARWARQLGDEIAIAVSASRDDDPLAACERAEALLALVSAELDRARGL